MKTKEGGVMDIQKEREVLQRLINEMNDVTNTWSVEQMVTHVWKQAKAQAVPDGYCVAPIESLEESLDWASVAKWDSPNNSRDEEINKHEEIIRAIIEAQEQKG